VRSRLGRATVASPMAIRKSIQRERLRSLEAKRLSGLPCSGTTMHQYGWSATRVGCP